MNGKSCVVNEALVRNYPHQHQQDSGGSCRARGSRSAATVGMGGDLGEILANVQTRTLKVELERLPCVT